MAIHFETEQRKVIPKHAVQHLALSLGSAVLHLLLYPYRQHQQRKQKQLVKLINQAYLNGLEVGLVQGYTEGYCMGLQQGYDQALIQKALLEQDDQKPNTDRWKDL